MSLDLFERQGFSGGFLTIAGVDEVGRGPLCGPVVAAAVIFPTGYTTTDITDSKKLTPKKRETLFLRIYNDALSVGIGVEDHHAIDRHNIRQATFMAMRQALGALDSVPDYVLVDGEAIPKLAIPQKGIIKGDCRSMSIAAASIIAKVTRDRMMQDYHAHFPMYGLDRHKGYPTRAHLLALQQHGPSPIHRRSFKPVKDMCS